MYLYVRYKVGICSIGSWAGGVSECVIVNIELRVSDVQCLAGDEVWNLEWMSPFLNL
jgi:hypothetical protein